MRQFLPRSRSLKCWAITFTLWQIVSASKNLDGSESSIMLMALNMPFSNRGYNWVFNISIKDAVMCLNSSQFMSMAAVSKSPLRRYSWKLQKLLFGFSEATAHVWHSGMISLSTGSCSKIYLCQLEVVPKFLLLFWKYHSDEKHHSHLCLRDEVAFPNL